MSENIVSMNIDKNLIKPIVEAQMKQFTKILKEG